MEKKTVCDTEISPTCSHSTHSFQSHDEASLVHWKTTTFVITITNILVDKNNTRGKINANTVSWLHVLQ
jgi:hypothetical protein